MIERPRLHDRGFARSYETLRVSRTESLERNLLVQRGVIAWMRAWSPCSAFNDMACHEDGGSPPRRGGFAGSPPAVSGALQIQVAQMLAGMVAEVSRN